MFTGRGSILGGTDIAGYNFQIDSGACAISGTIFGNDGTTTIGDGGGVIAYQTDPCANPEWA